MKLLVYILRQLVVALCFAVGGMLFVALPGIAVSAVHQLSGVDTLAILSFIPWLIVGLVPYVLPLGFLLAVVVTYGRLAADNEWTAIRMTGMNPARTLWPPMIVATALAALTMWLMGWQLPFIKQFQEQYTIDAVRNTITNLSPGRTDLNFGKFYLQANSRRGNEFRDVFIHVPQGDGSNSFRAKKVVIDFKDDIMLVLLTEARVVHGVQDLASEELTLRVDMSELVRRSSRSFEDIRYRTVTEILAGLRNGVYEGDIAYHARFELHRRGALSTTYFMFLVLGMPTGVLLRKGTQLGALSVAVGYALVYFLLAMRLSKELARVAILPPIIAAYAVNGLGMVAGLLLLRKTLRQ